MRIRGWLPLVFIGIVVFFVTGCSGTANLDKSLWDAVRAGDENLVRQLIGHGANVNATLSGKVTALMYIAENGTISDEYKMMDDLIAAGADVNARDDAGNNALIRAAQTANVNAMKALLVAKADPNSKGYGGTTPLIRLAENGRPSEKYYQVMKDIIAAGADVNARDDAGNSALIQVVKSADVNAVKILLAAKADPNGKSSRGRTPLMLLVENSQDGERRNQIMRDLITAGADVNARDDAGNTVLIQAAQTVDAAAVKILLDAKADVNGKASGGTTPLMYLAGLGSDSGYQIMRDLIAAGADVNARDDAGNTALFRAAQTSNVTAVKILLDAKAFVNAKVAGGTTPLIYLAEYGRDNASYQIMWDLIAYGANVNTSNNMGQTALDRATLTNNVPAIQILKR